MMMSDLRDFFLITADCHMQLYMSGVLEASLPYIPYKWTSRACLEVLAVLYPLPKDGYALLGKAILFDQVCSFGKNTHGEMREEEDIYLTSQIGQLNPGD